MKQSNNPPGRLKDSIKALTQRPTLSDDKLQDLLALQNDLLGDEEQSISLKPMDKPGRKRWIQSSAAALVIAIGLMFWVTQPSDYSEQIAYEVVKNHLKLKPLDLQTQSMEEITTFFTQLDFAPVSSSYLAKTADLKDSFLLGGRYCSIKGVTAAQLRYQKDALSTFYQVPYDKQLHGNIPSISQGETPQLLAVNGLNVQLWQEKGLLMVLVSQ